MNGQGTQAETSSSATSLRGEGLPGYLRRNAKVGALARFLKAIEEGQPAADCPRSSSSATAFAVAFADAGFCPVTSRPSVTT